MKVHTTKFCNWEFSNQLIMITRQKHHIIITILHLSPFMHAIYDIKLVGVKYILF